MSDHPVDGGGSLRSLLTRVRAGDRVLLGPGDWELDARLPRGIELVGEPGARLHGAMRVLVDGVVLRGLLLLPEGELELQMGTLRLEDCTLRGGAFVSAGGRLELIGGRVEDPPQEALAVAGATVVARGVELLRARQAAIAAQDAEIILDNCKILELDGNALDLVGGCEATLFGCRVEGRQASFPLIWAEASKVSLTDCALSGRGTAVQVAAGGSARLEGCELSQEGEDGGVLLRAQEGTLTLSTCLVRGAWAAGLWVDAEGVALAEACVFEDNDRWRPPSERSELFIAPGGQLGLTRCRLSRFQGQPLDLQTREQAVALARAGLDQHDAQSLALGLAAGAPISLGGEGGRSALHGLARAGDALSLARHLRGGARPDSTDDAGRTPLHEAADAETVRALLEGGVELFARDRSGGDALHSRAERPDAEGALRELVLRGLCPDRPDRDGAHPVARALLAGQGPNVVALVRLGADPDLLLPDGRLPLSVYSAEREQELVDALLEWGADPFKPDARGKKPRYYADPHRVFRRTFKRLRHDPWPAPAPAAALSRLGADVDAEDALEALRQAGVVETPALRLELGAAPLPWSELVEGGVGPSPFLPVGADPFGREALCLADGAFLCLRRHDLRALLAAGSELVGRAPASLEGFVRQEVATLGLHEVLGMLSVLDERRELELALGSMRKRVTRAFLRRGLDFMRPWVPEARARWEPRVPQAWSRLAQVFRDLDGDEVSEVFYHPTTLRARLDLADPVHPLAHAWLDHTRRYARLGGLAGWASLAAKRPLTARRLWGEEDTSPLPILELARDEAGCAWLHLGTGRAARLSKAERQDPQILNRMRWEEDLGALLQ